MSGKLDLCVFFDLSPDVLCIAGFDGYFKKINTSMIKLLGYTEEELYRQPINTFIHPDDCAATLEHRKLISQGLTLLNLENRYLTKEGNIVWLTWTSTPVSEASLIYGIAKDITHKKQVEASRNRLLTNLTRANQDLKQLSYTSSHDLRGPVNNLLSLFNLLDETPILDPKAQELLAIFKQATQSLKENVDHYVDLLKADNLEQPKESLCLNSVIDSVLQDIDSLVKSSQVIFNIDVTQCPDIHFNRTYLKSIFLNLITNALKYAHPDKAPVINISSQRTPEGYELVIQDNGIGFDMEKVKDKLFNLGEKFHDHQDSKGIGLYLVHNHVTSLGGKIHLESAPYAGARFTLVFPEPLFF